MSDLADTINVLNLNDWNATGTSVLSYIKSPIQTSSFTNNSELIGKALRQSILYFADTIDDTDRALCVLGNEFRTTRTHNYKLSNSDNEKSSETSANMEVTTFAPIAFDHIRTTIGITKDDFRSSFNDGELINFVNTGRSGSQMYKTYNDAYIIKTLRDHEAKFLIQILSGLYLRYSYTSSLMTRYVGLYSVNMYAVFSSQVFCVVMLNNLPSILNIHEIYDIKGSSVGRYSSVNLPSKRLKALKDLDFRSFYPYGIRIPHEVYRRLRLTIESDISELRKMMITDFSLMLGIYQLDEEIQYENNNNNEESSKLKPQLGLSALYWSTIPNYADVTSRDLDKNKTTDVSNTILMNKVITKPLQLIACPQEDTFSDSKIAKTSLGIPGVTHDGRRVLLYPAFIDCLQTFDSFKRMQNTIQNIRDPKHSSHYSVIHPNDYERRLLQFLFKRVFIDSKQTLNDLLASPILSDDCLQNDSNQSQSESFNEQDDSLDSSERFNFEYIH